MNAYQKGKERARDNAQRIEAYLEAVATSYGELAEIQNYLEVQGKRYGLLKEFKENGLI